MLVALENKKDEFIARVQLTRGEGNNKTREIQGGRTATRISAIRVSTNTSVATELTDAIADFFKIAQGGDAAKTAAVEGAQALLSTGLNALFGVVQGQGMEKTGFVVLYLNFAFVRIDYYVYSYCASGARWGAESSKSGACYVADLAVLKSEDLFPSEVDYLIAQSLDIPESVTNRDQQFEAIQEIKFRLVESRVLSRLLESDSIQFEDIAKIAGALTQSEKAIRDAFSSLDDYVPGGLTNPPMDEEANSGDLTGC